ncbi:MAG: GAF domain-containing protein, partial [Bacteroidota bacterium]
MSQESVVPITEDQLKPYYHKIYQQANRIAAGFLIGFFVLGILLALVHNTFLIGLTMGGLSLLLYFVIRSVAPGSELLRWVTSFLFWNFGVQFLLQMGGQSEIKYVFFIALTVLLFYENWKVFVPATLYALATVIYLNTAQDTEFFKTHFFNATPMSMTSFVIDMLSVLFFSVLCMGWARLQHAQTRESAKQAIMMEQQLSMMNANITFANSISQGNLKSDYTAHHADKLGQSLLNMRESLISAAEREEREKFANLGLARIGEILRQHADNLGKLCDQIIEEVIKYMKANQGSIFVMEGHDHDRHLVLMASRAWDRKKFSQKSIQIGEGLVGQAAIEKHTIFMTQVPEDYITITSGLGQANPRSILIVPLQADDTVVGVIELASFRIYQDYEIKFLEKVGESIASMVITTKNNEKNRELLNKSNLLTEQMRAQEEEIRQNMEEMQATQEEMHRKNREIERLLKIAGEKE